MDCSPDWLKTLRRASFRGVPFFVEDDSITYGRRLKVHEFPHRDRPFVEDLGEKAIEFSVTAYVASDNVLSEKAALVRACRQGGAGTIVLPTEGSIRVMPHSCTRQHSKDRLGLVAFQLTFTEAGSGFGTFTAALLERLVSVSAETAVSLIGADFISLYNTIGEVSWVSEAATEVIGQWLDGIEVVRSAITGSVSLPSAMESRGVQLLATVAGADRDLFARGSQVSKAASDLAYKLLVMQRGVRDYAVAGRGVLQVGSNSIDLLRPDIEGDLSTDIADVMELIRLSSPTPTIAIEALKVLATFDPSTFDGTDGLGVSAMAEATNESAIGSMMRRHALLELAIASAQASYPARQEAVQARADLAEFFEPELNIAGRDAFAALDEVRSRAAMAISRKVADLRPTVVVEANSSEPSLVWAWRLYGNTTKAPGLVARNRVRHPAFMPASFQAEAPE